MDSPDHHKPAQALSFEEAYSRLEEVVHRLEGGNLALEDATGLYEEGMKLAQLCNQLLSKAELRITQLKDAYSSSPADEPPQE